MPRKVLTSAKNHATITYLIFTRYNTCLLPTKFQPKVTIFGVFCVQYFHLTTQNGDIISLCVKMELEEETVK